MDEETLRQIESLPSVQALPHRQRVFVTAYVQTHSAAEGARRAGYKPNPKHHSQLSVQGGRLLKRADVAAAVRDAMRVRWQSIAMGPDEVLGRIARIARHDHRRVLALAESDPALASLDDDTAEAVQAAKIRVEVGRDGAPKARTVEYRTASKLQALELLARYHRLLQSDVSAGDVGAAFAEAMDRASRRAALRDAAAAAEDAIISGGDPSCGTPSIDHAPRSAVDEYAAGALDSARSEPGQRSTDSIDARE